MKKVILLALTAGLSMSTSALAATQQEERPDMVSTIEGQLETLGVGTRPGRPRPPTMLEDDFLEITTRPGRPRPPQLINV